MGRIKGFIQPTTELTNRFMGRIEGCPTSGCWLWARGILTCGYGIFGIGPDTVLAHRLSYMLFRGPIPDGLTIDHLCRVRACVNPWHLEPVPLRVNTLRGESESAKHARKTHCKWGHPFDEENTHYYWHRNVKRRMCKQCRDKRIASPEYKEKARRADRARYCKDRGLPIPDVVYKPAPRIHTPKGPRIDRINANKTHCLRGHEFTPENTYLKPGGGRQCRECVSMRHAKKAAEDKARKQLPALIIDTDQ